MTEAAVPIPYAAGARPRPSSFKPRIVALPGPRPEDGAAVPPAPGHGRYGTTLFRCGGCGTAARFEHDDQQYGRLVHRFLDRHARCGNAMEIKPL